MNHLYHLLEQYLSQHSEEQWSCASVVIQSSYRWPGAMMIIFVVIYLNQSIYLYFSMP